jgi:hypothetical protein
LFSLLAEAALASPWCLGSLVTPLMLRITSLGVRALLMAAVAMVSSMMAGLLGSPCVGAVTSPMLAGALVSSKVVGSLVSSLEIGALASPMVTGYLVPLPVVGAVLSP